MAILLVDDSATQRLILASLLEVEGYTTLLMAGSAAEAFDCLEQRAPGSVDLVLMDLHMPGLDGIEACGQIKAMAGWEDTPVIMVTSSDEVEDLKLAFAAGAMDYIIKPPNAVELLARIRSALKLKYEMDGRKARERELQEVNRQLEVVLADLARQHQLLQEEQVKSERLLLNILPRPVAERLKQQPGVVAQRFDAVTVMFADIVDFTVLAGGISPESVVNLLNEVFSLFDQLAEKHGLEKIKTIGDAYMVVGGLPLARPDHATAVAEMALDILRELPSIAGGLLHARIGLHSGPVVAGVIGRKKFIYDLWGDTVNIASRMEELGLPDGIQVTAETYQLLHDCYRFEKRGAISVKGKGPMNTYFLLDGKGSVV
ncbi:MAG: response regulator [Chloroflexi bacterium]|nr:response regulator [Chloroflexota bacterium]